MIKRLTLLSAVLLASHAQAAHLTTYVAEWTGYTDDSGYPAYPFDGAYKPDYDSVTTTPNADMVDKATKSDVIEFAFLQVWNQDLINAYKDQGAMQAWLGTVHFDDLWADLSNGKVDDYSLWTTACGTAATTGTFSDGTCAAVQMSNGAYKVLDYKRIPDQWSNPGQMDNFGAFLKLKTDGRKVIAIGGANTPTNNSVSTQSFQTIFANQDAYITSLTNFFNGLQGKGFDKYSGVDYDFEPPINADGSQKTPDASTTQDYSNLYKLVKATRTALGPDAYISVTITVNEAYLDAINASVEGGWFKQIQRYVDAINLMTYDLHGPWDTSADPGTLSHVMLKQPSNLSHSYAINYATQEVTAKVLGFGAYPGKLQVGLATYGRGFAKVAPGSDAAHPGFDQPWQGAAVLPAQYSNQEGMLPYKFVNNLVASGYQKYTVSEDGQTIAAYLYSPIDQQMIGYMSPELVDNTCDYIQQNGLQGAILWSADTDASFDGSQGVSLVSEYNNRCRALTKHRHV